jgi:hypothetical protein
MTADIVAIEGIYFAKAREIRERARMLKTAGKPREALALNGLARRLDGHGMAIIQKTTALARADAVNGTFNASGFNRGAGRGWLDWPADATVEGATP